MSPTVLEKYIMRSSPSHEVCQISLSHLSWASSWAGQKIWRSLVQTDGKRYRFQKKIRAPWRSSVILVFWYHPLTEEPLGRNRGWKSDQNSKSCYGSRKSSSNWALFWISSKKSELLSSYRYVLLYYWRLLLHHSSRPRKNSTSPRQLWRLSLFGKSLIRSWVQREFKWIYIIHSDILNLSCRDKGVLFSFSNNLCSHLMSRIS